MSCDTNIQASESEHEATPRFGRLLLALVLALLVILGVILASEAYYGLLEIG